MADAPRLTIIGMGFRGTSFGLAVRAAKRGWRVVGHDLSHDAAGKAKKLGALDSAEWNLPAAVEPADLVVVATPVTAVASGFRDIAPLLKPGSVGTDLAPTKAAVLRMADEILPESVSFVGGHPLVEPTEAELTDAKPSAKLFEGCDWCIVPSERAAAHAVDRVSVLARSVGASPLFIEAAEHDSYVAATGELPILLATALTNVLLEGPAAREFGRFAGEGFRAATRSVSDAPSALAGAALTNAASLRRWLDVCRAELDELASLFASAETSEAEAAAGADQLRAIGERARTARASWQASRPGRDAKGERRR